MSDRVIVSYTEKVAAELADTYAHDPLGELHTWVRLAHQREAMVTELYDLSRIDTRLEGASGPTVAFVRAAIASIWAHEESHTTFLATVRGVAGDGPVAAALTEIQGKLEGKIVGNAVSNHGTLARIAIAIGASLRRVPEFATDLGQLGMRGLVGFHAELETTARLGYERIRELIAAVGAEAPMKVEELFGYTFRYDVGKILCEEAFHEDAFDAMADWLAPGGDGFLDVPTGECARVLHDLCERNLSTGAVARRLLGGVSEKGDVPGAWISAGGLAELFARHDLPVPLWDGRTAASPLPFRL